MFEKVIAGLASDRELEVRAYGVGQVDLLIQKPFGVPYGIAIADKDVPNLMLALCEAAGVVPKWDETGSIGTPEHLAHIQWHLAKYVESQEAFAAQAEETAKLEAEALELYNQYRKVVHLEPCIDWDETHMLVRKQWLAVAQQARELGADK